MATDFHHPRRVLMTADTVGGVWTFAMELASAICEEEDTEILLAAFGGEPDSFQQREAASIRGLTLTAGNWKLEWMQDPWEDVAASAEWLRGLVREFHPDLLHLNTFAHAALDWDCPVVLTAHSCVATWWQAVKRTSLPEEWGRYRRLVHAALHAADTVAVPSADLLLNLRSIYDLPNDSSRFRVIANGRSAKLFYAGEKEPFILTGGRLWDEAKGVDTLIAAAPGLRWPVYLAGDRESRREHPNCLGLGRLGADVLAEFYARAAIYALPARYEPFGLSILEAALSGCALVLGDIASLRENWDGAAVFVCPGDTRALAVQIDALIEDPLRRSRLAAEGFRRAKRLTPEGMAQQYRALYREACHMREERLACVS